MTTKRIKLLLATLLMLCASAGATEITEDWNLEGTVSQQQPNWAAVNPAISQYVTVTGAQGEGSQPPSLGSTRLRLFSKNTLTITAKDASTSLKSLTFTFYSSSNTPKDNTEWTVSAGSFDYEKGVWSAGDETVTTLTITNTKSSQLSFTAVKAVYEVSGSGPVTIAKPSFSPTGVTPGKQPAANHADGQLSVELSSLQDVSIYYTLDGSVPTAQSTLYSAPVVLKATTTVSAIAIDANGNESDVAAYRYYIHKNDDQAFFYESFDNTLYWGGNDGDFNPDFTYSSSTLLLDNDNASYQGCLAVEQCTFLNNGQFLTSMFAKPVTKGTLTFRAASLSSGPCTMNLAISSGQLSLTSVQCKAGQWTDYTVDITNAASGAYITFSGYGFLDEVKVVREEVSATAETVTIGTDGYATYVNDIPLDLSTVDGLTAYIVSSEGYVEYEVENGKDLLGNPKMEKRKVYHANLLEVKQIPAATPFILKGQAGKRYDIPVCQVATENVSANLLEGTVEGFTVNNREVFLLRGGENGVGFYYARTNDVVGAHKAYLPASKTSSETDFIYLDKAAAELATAIQAPVAGSTTQERPAYNLQGQRSASHHRGVTVSNGRKVIVR